MRKSKAKTQFGICLRSDVCSCVNGNRHTSGVAHQTVIVILLGRDRPMWKQRPNGVDGVEPSRTPEPARPPVNGAVTESAARPQPATQDRAAIGKGIVVKGDITGADPVHIDGRVEGTIQIPSERVTVGKGGTVVGITGGAPCITAREIVVLGTVTGDISAGERVEIRAGASLTGDVTTIRVSIEDGAYFRGGIDIRREDPKTISAAARLKTVQPV